MDFDLQAFLARIKRPHLMVFELLNREQIAFTHVVQWLVAFVVVDSYTAIIFDNDSSYRWTQSGVPSSRVDDRTVRNNYSHSSIVSEEEQIPPFSAIFDNILQY